MGEAILLLHLFKMAMISAGWNPLGEAFYRRFELYTMEWDSNLLDLSRVHVAASPHGGPVALLSRPPSPAKPHIEIFNGAGRQIGAFKWNSGKLIGISWSASEDLICIQDDGTVLIYDMFGAFKRTVGMGQEAKEMRIVDCQTFTTEQGTGVAVMTTAFRIFVINNVESSDPRIRRMAEIPGLNSAPAAWSIYYSDRQTKALIAFDNELFLADTSGQQRPISLPLGNAADASLWRFVAISVSFNQKYLALLTDDGVLWVGELDFSKTHVVQSVGDNGAVIQMEFCGTGAVVIATEDALHVVGKSDEFSIFSEDGRVILIPELDGVRLLSVTKHEFLQRVPLPIEDVFKIGSLRAGSMLYEAYKEYDKKSKRADEYIRVILEQGIMNDAVGQCVMAAAEEFETKMQKDLLRAASFGKCFDTAIDSSDFVDVCQSLRILHGVRHDNQIAIPLTFSQLKQLTVPVLIDRLVLRRQYGLALRICQYLKMPEVDGAARILAHWARYKVLQQHIPDDTIAEAIVNKIKDTSGISYADIAEEAFEKGRPNLAIKLLDHEPKASKQGQLLLKMKEDKLALKKAIESGDTDFIYLVLLHMRSSPDMSLGKFLMILQNKDYQPAYHLFVQYCKERPERSQDLEYLYEQEINPNAMAEWHFAEGLKSEDLNARLSQLRIAAEKFKLQNEPHARFTEDQIKLLRFQKKIEDELQKPFLDQSLHETMYTLTTMGQHKYVEQLRKDFKVPDRRFCWMKVAALAEADDWSELEKFSNNKIAAKFGGEQFIDVCLQYNNKLEGKKYLSKVSKPNKVKYCLKVGQLDMAADLAAAAKNTDDLLLVMQSCGPGDAALVEKIRLLRAQLLERNR